MTEREQERAGGMTYPGWQQQRGILLDTLAERIDSVEQDMADDYASTEETGERVDLAEYVVELEIDLAKRLLSVLQEKTMLDAQGHRDDCAIRLPHPASICTCHIADKQRAETFANAQLLDAIAISDAAKKACPVNAGRIAAEDKCPLCGANANETCFRTAAADYRAMQIVRKARAHLSQDGEG